MLKEEKLLNNTFIIYYTQGRTSKKTFCVPVKCIRVRHLLKIFGKLKRLLIHSSNYFTAK